MLNLGNLCENFWYGNGDGRFGIWEVIKRNERVNEMIETLVVVVLAILIYGAPKLATEIERERDQRLKSTTVVRCLSSIWVYLHPSNIQ